MVATTIKSPQDDLHGRRRVLLNVVSSWVGQAILIVSGFLLPRLIDRSLGQDALGIWDFAWSLISHFGLLTGGIASSVNRYVAGFRSKGDLEGLNRAVSSVAGVLRVVGMLVLLLTVVCVWFMPVLLRETLSDHLSEARWLVLFLGASLAVQVAASVYGGVLTGCHRWDWHNGIYAVTYVVMLGGMVAVLHLGYGLVGLAVVNLVCETLGRAFRAGMCYPLCPGLAIRLRHMRLSTAYEMMGFGGKMLLWEAAYMLLTQTVSVIILATLGPASLALFSRPMALVRTVRVFMVKYAYVFVPTASSLHYAGETDALKSLTVKSARDGLFLCLPPMLFLGILGGELLDLWMGGIYSDSLLITLLAAVYFFGIAYTPLYCMLTGVNRHGRVAGVIFGGAAVGVGLVGGWLTVFDGGLPGVVLAFGLPWVLVNGFYLPIHACRRLGLPLGEFIASTWKRPLLCCLPYTICLVAVRWLHPGPAWQTLVCGVAIGGGILLVCYWIFVIPPAWKSKLVGRFQPSASSRASNYSRRLR